MLSSSRDDVVTTWTLRTGHMTHKHFFYLSCYWSIGVTLFLIKKKSSNSLANPGPLQTWAPRLQPRVAFALICVCVCVFARVWVCVSDLSVSVCVLSMCLCVCVHACVTSLWLTLPSLQTGLRPPGLYLGPISPEETLAFSETSK